MLSSVTAVDVKSVGQSLMAEYKKNATTQTKISDLFLAFILVTGILQVLYCVIVGSFPFNSFLSGFLSCVGMFALTGTFVRIQDMVVGEGLGRKGGREGQEGGGGEDLRAHDLPPISAFHCLCLLQYLHDYHVRQLGGKEQGEGSSRVGVLLSPNSPLPNFTLAYLLPTTHTLMYTLTLSRSSSCT